MMESKLLPVQSGSLYSKTKQPGLGLRIREELILGEEYLRKYGACVADVGDEARDVVVEVRGEGDARAGGGGGERVAHRPRGAVGRRVNANGSGE